ncbi:MAG: hypothetical protein ACJ789_02475 [Thermomicrobiales bacterium]
MHSHTYPRLLLVGFLFAFIAAGFSHFEAGAEGVHEWTDTTSQEDTLAATCPGLDLTTSYLVKSSYQVIEEYPGREALESQRVSFTGAIGNGLDDSSYGYDGFYTRTTDQFQRKAWVTDLLLHFGTGTPKAVTVSLARADFDLTDNPVDAIQVLVTTVLQTDLCGLVGGPASTLDWGVAPSNLPAGVDDFQTCAVRPSMGLPYGC